MDLKICLTIFGIIALTNGRPAKDDSALIVTNENELQQVLKALNTGDGGVDIAFSHHEDGPKTHHEDRTHFFRHPDASHDNQRHSHKRQRHHDSHHHTEDQPRLTNIQTLNLFYKKKPHEEEFHHDDSTSSDEDIDTLLGLRNKNVGRSGYDNVNEVIEMLKNLDGKVATTNKADERCAGGACASGRSVNKNDRGNKNRDDDDDGDDDNKNKNRNDNNNNDRDDCRDGNCGGNRDDNANRVKNDKNNYFDRNNVNDLQCFGGLCSKAIRIFDGDVDNYYNNVNRADDDRDDNNDAQCNGDRCDTDQSYLRERRLPTGDTHLQHLFNSQAQKFKISDDLDAIVLDVSDLDKIFGSPNSYGQGKESDVHDNEDLENDNTHGSNRDSESKIEAVVVDLSKSNNDLTNEIKSLVNKIQGSLKRKNDQVEPVKKARLRGDSKILPHNEKNNNVYVPKWLLEEVIARANRRDSEQNLKNLFPLTTKQKEKLAKAMAAKKMKRIFRRSIQDDVGVPFHLEIQGLGQVNP